MDTKTTLRGRLWAAMMRRMGVTIEDIGAAGYSPDITLSGIARDCLMCRSRERCRTWLVRGGANNYDGFCLNEQFFRHVRAHRPKAGLQ